jgi:hypothetical protein
MQSYTQFITEAKKKVKVLRTSHYTTASNKSEIMRGGFKDSPSTGTYHPDDRKGVVYTTPSSRVGSDYGSARVSMRMVNPKVTSTDSPRDFGKNIKSWMVSSSIEDINDKKGKPTSSVDQARSAFKKGDKVVRVPNAHGGFTPREGQVQGSYIMMDKDVANKSIDKNPSPTFKAKGKEKRTKTTPKKTLREFLEESARRRLSFTRFHHGSDSDSIKSIRKSGPKSSREGSQGPGHYVTPDQSKARKYAEFTSKQRGKKPAVVSYRVSSDKITKVDDIPKKLSAEPQVSSKKPVVHNTRTGHAVVDSDYAKGKIIKSNSTVGAKGKEKRTKTQPKKDT